MRAASEARQKDHVSQRTLTSAVDCTLYLSYPLVCCATAVAAAEFRSRPPATHPLRSSRPLPTPRAQQQHQHDQYMSAAAPRFAATAAATTLIAPPNRTAALRPRSELFTSHSPPPAVVHLHVNGHISNVTHP